MQFSFSKNQFDYMKQKLKQFSIAQTLHMTLVFHG